MPRKLDYFCLLTNAIMMAWSIYEMVLYPPTRICFYPWVCLLGMIFGNLSLFLYTAGNVICSCWHGGSEDIKKSVPGCVFWLACILSGACYIWDMIIVGIVNFNIKKPICENTYHIVLLGHFIHGIILIISFLGMYIIKNCFLKKIIKDNNSPV